MHLWTYVDLLLLSCLVWPCLAAVCMWGGHGVSVAFDTASPVVVCEVDTREREENEGEKGMGRREVVQTLACSQEQWRRSRKNPSECLLSREAAYNKCWERRRDVLVHTHTLDTLLRELLTLFSSNASTILFRALCAQESKIWCVYVFVQCQSSLTLSTFCSVVRPTWSSLQEPLPLVLYNMQDLQTTDSATSTVTKCASLCTRLRG